MPVWQNPLDPEVEALVDKYARELGFDPKLALAVAGQESGGQGRIAKARTARSPKGAQGIMQVMPATSKELEPKYGPDKARQGIGYLTELRERYKDTPNPTEFTLAAYNAGPGRLSQARKRAGAAGKDPNNWAHVAPFLPGETRDYVPKVMWRHQNRLAAAEKAMERGRKSEVAAVAPSETPAAAPTAEQPLSFDALYQQIQGW